MKKQSKNKYLNIFFIGILLIVLIYEAFQLYEKNNQTKRSVIKKDYQWQSGVKIGEKINSSQFNVIKKTIGPINNGDKAIILIFFSFGCTACYDLLFMADSISKNIAKNIKVIALTNVSPTDIDFFKKKFNLSLTIVSDRGNKLKRTLDIFDNSWVVVFDKELKILYNGYPLSEKDDQKAKFLEIFK